MAIQPTAAAKTLQDKQESVSSHELISLLLEGGLERIAQAKASIADGNQEETPVLINKVVAIIDGLRSSLDFDQGGEIASNLEALYDYMIGRIQDLSSDDRSQVIKEVGDLLGVLKKGWDKMPKQ